jgi:CelD/BcsL family acetyltransferase involved in cellulose biosynthesis
MNTVLQLAQDSVILNVQNTSLTVDILTGERAMNTVADNEFLTKWDDLYLACPWGTVFQSKEFVCPWYQLYHSSFIPLIAKAELNGQLIGLLTLTIEKEKRLIMAAGLGSAEYQTWLALPSLGEIFITKTLGKLQSLYPGYSINLYNTTPETPLGWTTNINWQKRCQTKSLRRPLMDLRDPEVSKLFRKKQFREKTNRLKRMGTLSFEKITDAEQFESILDELAAQSDFRKGAKFNHSEFKNDTARRLFLIELFKQGVLHTTVLKLNEQIIASIAACAGRGSVHLAGINTYSPMLSKYSPGTINFVMLGQLLMEEGLDMFDLTPGGDAYKERLATSHDYVHDLYVSSELKVLFNRKMIWPIANLMKSHLNKHGITPGKLKFDLAKFKQRLALARKNNLSNLFSWHYLISGFRKRQEVVTCNFQQDGIRADLRINALQDLLQYEPQHGHVIRWDFLEDAMRRFEEGGNVYTLIKNETLIFCAWHSTQTPAPLSLPPIPADAVFLDGIYCHPAVTEQLISLLNNVACEITSDYKAVHCLIDVQYKKALN